MGSGSKVCPRPRALVGRAALPPKSDVVLQLSGGSGRGLSQKSPTRQASGLPTVGSHWTVLSQARLLPVAYVCPQPVPTSALGCRTHPTPLVSKAAMPDPQHLTGSVCSLGVCNLGITCKQQAHRSAGQILDVSPQLSSILNPTYRRIVIIMTDIYWVLRKCHVAP